MLIWSVCTVWEESTLHDSYSSQSVKKTVKPSPVIQQLPGNQGRMPGERSHSGHATLGHALKVPESDSPS